MADFSNPKNANPLLSFLGYIRDCFTSVAKMFDGTTDSNVPVGAKKIDGSTKVVSQWNGSSWDVIGSVASGTKVFYVSNNGSGDNSGIDTSNYMPWVTFRAMYFVADNTNLSPSPSSFALYISAGSYATSASEDTLVGVNMSISILGGNSVEFTGAALKFYNCNITIASGKTLYWGSSVTGFEFHNCQIYGGDIGSIWQILMYNCLINLNAISSSPLGLTLYNCNTTLVSFPSTSLVLDGGNLRVNGSISVGAFVFTNCAKVSINGNLTATSNSVVSYNSTLQVLVEVSAPHINVSVGSRVVADAFTSWSSAADITGFSEVIVNNINQPPSPYNNLIIWNRYGQVKADGVFLNMMQTGVGSATGDIFVSRNRATIGASFLRMRGILYNPTAGTMAGFVLDLSQFYSNTDPLEGVFIGMLNATAIDAACGSQLLLASTTGCTLQLANAGNEKYPILTSTVLTTVYARCMYEYDILL